MVELTVESPMPVIARALTHPDSGLDIRDRMWLKINIPNAFIGKPSSVADPLTVFFHVQRAITVTCDTRYRL